MPVRGARQGHPELADIFRIHGKRLDGLNAQQRRVVAAILSCRTAALGGHVRECDRGCGYQEISYNSCRDRHCPKCQGLERVRWQEARARDLLPVLQEDGALGAERQRDELRCRRERLELVAVDDDEVAAPDELGRDRRGRRRVEAEERGAGRRSARNGDFLRESRWFAASVVLQMAG